MDRNGIGAYIHIPFCIQRCHYCDFATYSKDQISPNQEYVDTVCLEIQKRSSLFESKRLSTIYFGGGTPSLLDAHQIEQIIQAYKINGFEFNDDIEITIEANPATMNESKVLKYKDIGVNRISIGCQSFNDEYLKNCNREHNAQDTLDTIELVKSHFQNYSLDLLFSLPFQTMKALKEDLDTLCDINPPHISAYCLTVPEKHPMNQNRCSEAEQVKMFDKVLSSFKEIGLNRYEISNFSKPGFESRHNNLYWLDKDYWGVGLSAHSYSRNPGWGTRFWNPNGYEGYMKSIRDLEVYGTIDQSFQKNQRENLSKHESLSDYCHTHLRLESGLKIEGVRQKFGQHCSRQVDQRLQGLLSQNFVKKRDKGWSLTDQGVLVSNIVFSELLFSSQDIDKD